MKWLKKVLLSVVSIAMVLTMTPSNTRNVKALDTPAYENSTDFMKVFHLDAGRRYFTVSEIKGIIDQLAENDFTHLQLAFGNDALRFLLDDMAVSTYSSDNVKDAIHGGNQSYDSSKNYNPGTVEELSQQDMNDIIEYANTKGISIIPLLNTPGHMTTLVSAMKTLGVSNSGSSDNMNLSDAAQLDFVKELMQKYINYFADKGCKYFNMGADEYSFSGLNSDGYSSFVTYVNDVAEKITAQSMTPIAFNDGIYYGNFETEADKINKNIVVAYWCQKTNYAPASTLASKGFKLLNNNSNWYYVYGDALYGQWAQGQWGYEDSKNNLKEKKCTEFDTEDSTGVSPIGSVLCLWCDYPGKTDYSERIKNQVYDLINTMAISNPDYFDVNGSDDNNNNTETINITVGQTVTRTIEGVDYSNNIDRKELDDEIALVSAKFGSISNKKLEKVTQIESGKQYIIVNNRAGKVLNDTTYSSGLLLDGVATVDSEEIWTITKNGSTYNVKNSGDRYLQISNGNASLNNTKQSITLNYTDGSDGYWTLSQNSAYLNDYQGRGTTAAGWRDNSASTDPGSKWTIYQVASEDINGTTITFEGKMLGTTYVTVGNIRYTINVVEEDLTDASDLPIQLWVTNSPIEVTNLTTRTNDQFNAYYNGGYAQYVTIKAEDAYGVNGKKLEELVPPGVNKTNGVTTSDDTNALYVLWKGTVLNNDTGKQGVWGENKCNVGSNYNYVRYYNGKWEVSIDQGNWTEVTGNGSTVSYSACTEQIIAYYMQRTEITEQVITDTVDYGEILSENVSPDHSNISSGQYVILDYAVKYPNGNRVPNDFRVDGKTLLYHCAGDDADDDGVADVYRRLNTIQATETSSYEVYMITITPTTDSGTTFKQGVVPTSYSYAGEERVIWAENEDVIPEGYSTVAELDTDDKNYGPVSYGGEPIIDELYINNLQGMLITYYIRGKQTEDSLQVRYVDDSTGNVFYHTDIPVINTSGQEDKTFNNALLDKEGNVYQVPGNEILTDNEYYVKDPYNANFYIRSDLTKIVDLKGVYSTGIYQHVKAEVDANNPKVLILHYQLDASKAEKSLVVDFGLPIEVTAEQLFDNVTDVKAFEKIGDGTFGDVECNGTTFTYTPNKVLTNSDVVSIRVKYNDVNTSDSIVKIAFVPATTVYYEEGFAEYNEGSWNEGISKGSEMQATQIAGKSSDEYGFDVKYSNETGMSNGTQATSSQKGDSAVLTFKGTGVDIYANCSESTGKITILVKNSKQETVKLAVVDTTSNSEIYNDYSGKPEYNLPILSLTGLEHDTYTVKMVVYGNGKKINLDGFRVYGTLETEPDFYENDKEDKPIFIELRDEVLDILNVTADSTSGQVYKQLNDDDKTDGVVILSGNNYTEDEKDKLLNHGPKNELFLLPGQSITFKVKTNREVQIGLKAPVASTEFTINGARKSITTSTDMFYTVGKENDSDGLTVAIANNGVSILSITKVKVCDDPNVKFGTLTETDINNTLIAMGIVKEEQKSDAKLIIKVNDRTTVLTANGIVGEVNTFKANDIQVAAESLVEYGYELKNVQFKDTTVAYGEENTIEFTATKKVNKPISSIGKIFGFVKKIIGWFF